MTLFKKKKTVSVKYLNDGLLTETIDNLLLITAAKQSYHLSLSAPRHAKRTSKQTFILSAPVSLTYNNNRTKTHKHKKVASYHENHTKLPKGENKNYFRYLSPAIQ